MKIGVIAEETNDVDVLYRLTCKIISESNFSFKHFVGHGCGKLRRKCSAWADNLIKCGYSYIVVLHDLDNYDQEKLRAELSKSVEHPSCQAYLILLPVREMEAWLLTDPKALKKIFSLPVEPKLPENPEMILDPKKELRNIVRKHGKKQYLNTVHNVKIAEAINISKLKACKSFHPYPKFLTQHVMKTLPNVN